MSAQSRRATGSAAASTGPASDASAITASSTPTATAAHPRRRSLLPTSTAQPSPTPPLARRVSNPRAPRPPTNPPHPLPPPADSAPHDSMDLDDPTLSYSSRQQATTPTPTSHPPLTLSDLDSTAAPAGYEYVGSRHVRDEIEELLYQLQVKEKEIRMSRGGVEEGVGAMRRSLKKLQRDTDDLLRTQQAAIKAFASTH